MQDTGQRKKNEFILNKTYRLGHDIDENGIGANEEKIKAIIDWKHSENQNT